MSDDEKRLEDVEELAAWTGFALAALSATINATRMENDSDIVDGAAHYADRMLEHWRARHPDAFRPRTPQATTEEKKR